MKYFFSTFLGLLTLVGFVPKVSAQEDLGSVSVTPLIVEISQEPGQTYEQEIVVRNTNGRVMEVVAEAFDVEIEPVSHNVRFLPESSRGNQQRSLASWLEFPEEPFRLAPGETESFSVQVVAPSIANPGDYYASINFYYSPIDADQDDGTVKVRQSIGSLVLLQLSGEEVAETDDYVFSDVRMEPSGDNVKVLVSASNDTLRYAHIRPQLTIFDEGGEVYYQSLGAITRVFPGETLDISHRFPREYLDSIIPLTLKVDLQGQTADTLYYSREISLVDADSSSMMASPNVIAIVIIIAVLFLISCWYLKKRQSASQKTKMVTRKRSKSSKKPSK